MSEDNQMAQQPNNRINLNFDLRLVIVLLLAVIAAMLLMWKPWERASSGADTVSVTGEAKLKAEPDEFVFYPSYQFKNANKDAALAEATAKSNEIIKKLKELDVPDNKIKADTSGFDTASYPIQDSRETPTYNLQLTVTVGSKEQAQKVQDYLVTTSPSGSVSPQGTFSEAKRKELEDKGRDEATKDARQKADKTARNLGFKVGKVKSVTDGAGFSDPRPYDQLMEVRSTSASLPVQQGENEYTYSVSVVYYVR